MALLVIWVFALVAVVVGVFSIIIWLMLSEQRFKKYCISIRNDYRAINKEILEEKKAKKKKDELDNLIKRLQGKQGK